MRRVLQINASANWGSTGRIAEGINNEARLHGWETYIAYSRIANNSKSQLIKIGNKFDILTAVAETRLLDMAGLGMRHATKKLISTINAINPDIIHLHNIHGYVLNFEMLFNYLKSTNIHIVWTFHDFWAMTGHCCHFCYINCDKWKVECHKCPIHKAYPSSWTDFSTRNFNKKKAVFSSVKRMHIIPVSKWVDSLIQYSFLSKFPRTCIVNGVNTDVFKPIDGFKHPQISDNDFVILGVASQWNYGKGLEDFIKLSKILSADEKILLIGVDEKQSMKLRLHNILCLNRTTSLHLLAEAYSRANVLVSFSSAETFGLTILEAMSCGTPAVVYNNTAPPYLIKDKVGYVANDGDYKDAYKYIRIIKTNGRSYYSQSCRSHVVKNYKENESFRQYVELYENIITKQ